MTKICDFPYPIYHLTIKFDTLFMTVAAGTVALNIVHEGLLLMVLSIKMKKYNPGQKSWDTLYFVKVWSFGPPPPPHPQQNVDVDSSKVDPLFQRCFWRSGGLRKLNNDFPIQNKASPVVILSSVPRTFGQDCRCKNHALFQRQNGQNDTLFMTKAADKPYPLGPHIPI